MIFLRLPPAAHQKKDGTAPIPKSCTVFFLASLCLFIFSVSAEPQPRYRIFLQLSDKQRPYCVENGDDHDADIGEDRQPHVSDS